MRRHDIQPNNNQSDDIWGNNRKHLNTQYGDSGNHNTRLNDTQHSSITILSLIDCTQRKNTQNNDTWHNGGVRWLSVDGHSVDGHLRRPLLSCHNVAMV